jgi:predicted MFS family arabinose efflux permease
MVATNTTRFAILAIVSAAMLLDVMSLPLLYAAVLVLGCAEVMFDSATIVVVPKMVGPAQLDRANSWISGGQGVANDFLGAPLAGVLISVALVLPFIGHSVAAGVSALMMALLVGAFGATTEPKEQAPKTRLRTEVAEGMRWLWRHDFLRSLAISTAVVGATTWSFLATFVLFGQEILGMGSTAYGVTIAVAGLGVVIGSALVPRLTRLLGRGWLLALTLGVPGVLFIVASATSTAVVVAGVLLFWGLLIAAWNVITVSLRQILVPDGMLGRVGSVYRFLAIGSASIGILVGSGIVSAVAAVSTREIGLRSPFFIAGVAHIVLFFVALRTLSDARIEAATSTATPQDSASR